MEIITIFADELLTCEKMISFVATTDKSSIG